MKYLYFKRSSGELRVRDFSFEPEFGGRQTGLGFLHKYIVASVETMSQVACAHIREATTLPPPSRVPVREKI
ncbi:unnamed protein product [Amoebophrya sp. A120]|nr:unnamed protein product [Amoebophrya sp. A120]|eukprot:GSA120T00000361001.1